MTESASSGWFDQGVHILPVRIYYEDTDVSGVVYHANYLRYMERGRSDYLRLVGVHHNELMSGDAAVSWAIRHLDIDFLKPARIDDSLEVHTSYTKLTGARLFARQIVKRADEDLVRADLEAVCVSLEGRATRIPRSVRETLMRHIQAD